MCATPKVQRRVGRVRPRKRGEAAENTRRRSPHQRGEKRQRACHRRRGTSVGVAYVWVSRTRLLLPPPPPRPGCLLPAEASAPTETSCPASSGQNTFFTGLMTRSRERESQRVRVCGRKASKNEDVVFVRVFGFFHQVRIPRCPFLTGTCQGKGPVGAGRGGGSRTCFAGTAPRASRGKSVVVALAVRSAAGGVLLILSGGEKTKPRWWRGALVLTDAWQNGQSPVRLPSPR